MDRGSLFAGTSGFAYQEWKGTFYPEDLSADRMLEHYAGTLPSVEINYTFRRLPAVATLEKWRGQVPDDFRITLKAHQRITHFKRLADCDEDVREFLDRARVLGERLGVVLFQLPPNFVFERERFEQFLGALPPVAKYAFEFRNPSWNAAEVSELLEKHGVARCGAETEKESLETVPITADHCYLRLRKEEYTSDEIQSWAKRVDEALDSGRDVYCYFKHEGGGLGPHWARSLLDSVR
jgi:uncharacterized protein YecE (DUF72 family)